MGIEKQYKIVGRNVWLKKLHMSRLFVFLSLLVLFATDASLAQPGDVRWNDAGDAVSELPATKLVDRFYTLNGNRLFWLQDSSSGKLNGLIHCLLHADDYGLARQRYPVQSLKAYRCNAPGSERALLATDRTITKVALAFCKDLYSGVDMARWISYDGVSKKYLESTDSRLAEGLIQVKDSASMIAFVASLEPQTSSFRLMKAALETAKSEANHLRQMQLITTLNYYRWIWHFPLDSFIIINIPSATLKYYKADSLALEMKVVVGEAGKKTPRFAAYCTEVTLYPYWNMPRSILVNEWLSAFRKNPKLISFLNMEVIDAKGRVVSPYSINWNRITKANFPYRIREKTGCFNPLGVIKFTLASPFDVYMHDTNFKGAFLAANRYYSHGCIRLEKPVELADAVLVDKVDTGFLKACYRDQPPQVIPLAVPVPVFVVYMCADADGGVGHFYKDIYGLLK